MHCLKIISTAVRSEQPQMQHPADDIHSSSACLRSTWLVWQALVPSISGAMHYDCNCFGDDVPLTRCCCSTCPSSCTFGKTCSATSSAIPSSSPKSITASTFARHCSRRVRQDSYCTFCALVLCFRAYDTLQRQRSRLLLVTETQPLDLTMCMVLDIDASLHCCTQRLPAWFSIIC